MPRIGVVVAGLAAALVPLGLASGRKPADGSRSGVLGVSPQ